MGFLKDILMFIFGFLKNSKKSKSVFYHDIHSDMKFTDMSTSVDLFEKHILLIRFMGFEIVSEITKEQNEIEISFDDAWQGIFENIEVVNRLKVPVTIFVITSFISKNNYLSEEQIIQLSKNPLITFQSHTNSHADLPFISDKKLVDELKKSKEILEKIIKKEVSSVCFPKGLFSEKVVKIANEVGYKKQYSSLPGSFSNEVLPSVKRRSLIQFSSLSSLKNILRGGDNILNYWYTKKHYTR